MSTEAMEMTSIEASRVGLVGLGRMGLGMARRWMRRARRVDGFDLSEARRDEAASYGVEVHESLETLVESLSPPRILWVMVPHGPPTRQTVEALADLLGRDDLVVDGGNSRWSESIRNGAICEERGVMFLDVGVSGGVWGLEEGYNLMAGGSRDAFERVEPILRDLAPEGGYAHVGERSGAGHFVKMIHNAVEYGMLQAIGEGFECLRRSEFELDLAQIAELWQRGAVVRSWLLELLSRALREEGDALSRIEGFVEDSGTGRWSVEWAVDNAVPLPAITAALYQRFASRQEERYSAKAIAALRHQFGGHAVQEEAAGADGAGAAGPKDSGSATTAARKR